MADWQETYRAVVFPWNCDHYGHMNVRWYAHHFDDAGFHIWTVAGMGQAAIRARNIGLVVARTTIDYLHELRAGELLVIKSGFTRIGTKSITHVGRMYNADTGTLCATQEAVEVFFDPASRTSAPMPDDIREFLQTRIVSLDDD
jgi:acyl-CoA thioester hydrolase